jgi:tellurite resistance protein TerB
MSERHAPITAIAKLTGNHLNHSDEELMQALVTVGALVALADGQVEPVERHELVNFIHRQGFVPTISQDRIAEAFDNRVRQIEDRDGANVTAEALRPLAGLSLASVVVRTAGRVAAANQKIHPGELQALKLIRLMMMTFPVKKACDSPRTSINALSHVKRPRLRGRKPSEPRLPRYYFTIRSSDHENIDPQGTELADDDAALDYACRMIRWLQASGGYDDPGLMLQVRNEKREIVLFIPFLPAYA